MYLLSSLVSASVGTRHPTSVYVSTQPVRLEPHCSGCGDTAENRRNQDSCPRGYRLVVGRQARNHQGTGMFPIFRSSESNRGKRSREKGRDDQSEESMILNGTAWKGLSGKMALECRPEGSEGESISGRSNRTCKGPGAGVCLGLSKAFEQAPVCGAGTWI